MIVSEGMNIMNAGTVCEGFTLIEAMIVIAIIGLLASIALPSYQQYVRETRNSSCLSEAKNYSNEVLYKLQDQDNSSSPNEPIIIACSSITDASGWTLATQQKIVAVAKAPSSTRIECDIPNGAPCQILP